MASTSSRKYLCQTRSSCSLTITGGKSAKTDIVGDIKTTTKTPQTTPSPTKNHQDTLKNIPHHPNTNLRVPSIEMRSSCIATCQKGSSRWSLVITNSRSGRRRRMMMWFRRGRRMSVRTVVTGRLCERKGRKSCCERLVGVCCSFLFTCRHLSPGVWGQRLRLWVELNWILRFEIDLNKRYCATLFLWIIVKIENDFPSARLSSCA